MQKLSLITKSLDWDELRLKQMSEILNKGCWKQKIKQKEFKDDDQIVYLKHCIKNFSSADNLQWLQNQFKEDELKLILSSLKLYDDSQSTRNSYTDKDAVPIYLLIQGGIDVYDNDTQQKKYRDRECVLSNSFTSMLVHVIMENTKAFQVDRALMNQIKNNTLNQERRQKVLQVCRNLPIITSLDLESQEQVLTTLIPVTKPQGSIMTVPRAGSSDVHLLTSGTVVVWAYNNNTIYGQQFIILGCQRNEGILNEARLFDQESEYGSLVVEGVAEGAKLFTMSRESLSKLENDQVLQQMRAAYQSKQRLYRSLLERIGALQSEAEVKSVQLKICQKNRINIDEITSILLANLKQGVVESTNKQEQREKNLRMFESKMGVNPLKNALNQMTDREKTLCMGTPRIAHGKKDGFFGLTATQENSLFALRQMGTTIRKGTSTTNSVMPMPSEQIIRNKNALLEEEKDQAFEIANKKSFSHRKLNDQEQSYENIKSKLNMSQDQLIQKYEQRRIQEGTEFTINIDAPLVVKVVPTKAPVELRVKDQAIAKKRIALMKLGI